MLYTLGRCQKLGNLCITYGISSSGRQKLVDWMRRACRLPGALPQGWTKTGPFQACPCRWISPTDFLWRTRGARASFHFVLGPRRRNVLRRPDLGTRLDRRDTRSRPGPEVLRQNAYRRRHAATVGATPRYRQAEWPASHRCKFRGIRLRHPCLPPWTGAQIGPQFSINGQLRNCAIVRCTSKTRCWSDMVSRGTRSCSHWPPAHDFCSHFPSCRMP